MSSLTQEQRESYWRYNLRLTIDPAVDLVRRRPTCSRRPLRRRRSTRSVFLGFPLGYYMAAQGSLAIFVIEIAVYARLMNKKDLEYGIREEG